MLQYGVDAIWLGDVGAGVGWGNLPIEKARRGYKLFHFVLGEQLVIEVIYERLVLS